jgi:hypothetical protein
MVAGEATIDELIVGGAVGPWRGLGFAVDGAGIDVGTVRLRLAGPDSEDGLLSWSLRDVASTDLDGLPTARSEAPPAEPAKHQNGATQIDHVVVFTPDFERTNDALEAAGISLRRVREAEYEDQPVRQAFYRLGEVILEVSAHPKVPAGPARFWGLVFVVADIDASAELLGERLGQIRDAVQPGRRIATVRPEAALGLPVALISSVAS